MTSVRQQIPSLWKFYSVYEEIPEFLDEIDVYTYFHRNIFHISQSHHRVVLVREGSNKKSFAFKWFQICDIKTHQRYILQENTKSPKDNSVPWSKVCAIYLEAFDKASKCLQIPLPKPKTEIKTTESADDLFTQLYNDIIEYPNWGISLSFLSGNNNSCVFSIKKFELHANQFVLTEIVNLNPRENHHLYKNRYYVANACEINESIYDV